MLLKALRVMWEDCVAPIFIASIFLLSFYTAKLGIAIAHALHCVIDWFDVFDE